jgi:hypothetical protein
MALAIPTPFVEETFLSPLSDLVTIVTDQLTAWVHVWTLSSVPIDCISVHTTLLSTVTLFFLFNSVLSAWNPLLFPVTLRIGFSILPPSLARQVAHN